MTRGSLRIKGWVGCGVWGWGGGGYYYYHYCLLNNCLFCFSFVIFTWLSVSWPASSTLAEYGEGACIHMLWRRRGVVEIAVWWDFVFFSR